MAGSKQVIIWILLLAGPWSFAQKDRYMAFFSDKNKTTYSLNQPEDFLSQRAIDRKFKMNVALDSMDLPVDKRYVDSLRSHGVEVYFASKWLNAALVQMTTSERNDVAALGFVDSVKYIAKGAKLTTDNPAYDIPDSFRAPDRISANTLEQLDMIGADNMHEDGYTGDGMLIAVFDDGFVGVNEFEPFEHLFQANKFLGGKDFVTNSDNVFQFDDHGTAVLSCIAARYGDDVSGTAPDASFLLYITEDVSSEYRVEEYNWLLAAEQADSAGVDVINGSLGYSTFSDNSMNYSYEDMDGHTTIVARAASIASDKGMVVVVSAGNEGNGSWAYITSPADADNILSIGSVDSDRKKSGFSSVGPTADGRVKPDVSAMGSFTTIFYVSGSDGVISTGNGTSFSSPQVAGLAAGLLQAKLQWTHLELMDFLRKSGDQSNKPDSLTGYGIPNYNRAINGNTITALDILEHDINVYPNPLESGRLFIDFENVTFDHRLEVVLMDSQGRHIYQEQLKRNQIPGKLEIGLTPTRSGVYFLTLRSGKFEKTVKLIKI